MLAEPGISSEWKVFNTSYAFYLAVLAQHDPRHERARRGRGGATPARLRPKASSAGLRHAPWSNPAFSGMALSLVLFGFLGGISGVVLGTEQINLLMHNTLYVPGHFHATVVLPGRRWPSWRSPIWWCPWCSVTELIMKKVAKWQPYVFAIGVAGTSLFMMGAGTLGVSRRHWDITFGEAVLSFDYPGTAFLMMGLNGIFGVIAGDRRCDVHRRRCRLDSLRQNARRRRGQVQPRGLRRRRSGDDLWQRGYAEAAGHHHVWSASSSSPSCSTTSSTGSSCRRSGP